MVASCDRPCHTLAHIPPARTISKHRTAQSVFCFVARKGLEVGRGAVPIMALRATSALATFDSGLDAALHVARELTSVPISFVRPDAVAAGAIATDGARLT